MVLLSRGRVAWIEFKAPGGKLSPEQTGWHARAVRLGHAVAVLDDAQAAVEFVRRVEGMR